MPPKAIKEKTAPMISTILRLERGDRMEADFTGVAFRRQVEIGGPMLRRKRESPGAPPGVMASIPVPLAGGEYDSA